MTTEPQGSEQDQPQGESTDTEPTPPQGEQGTDWQRESRKWEARAKKDAQALADLRKQLGQMVSPDQVADKDRAVAEAQSLAAQASLAAAKYRVALAEGLPIDLAERLVGDDDDALREDAARLKALLKPSAPAADARKGQAGEKADAKPSGNELIRLIAKG